MAEHETSTRTGGTGGTDSAAEPHPAGGSAPGSGTESESLASGDDSVDAAIGGGGHVAGTGSSVARSGKRSSEGNADLPNPPGAGDPGGMGGVATNRMKRHDSPPGGASPLEREGNEKHRA